MVRPMVSRSASFGAELNLRLCYYQIVAGLFIWDAFSDRRTGQSFAIATGSHHRSHIYLCWKLELILLHEFFIFVMSNVLSFPCPSWVLEAAVAQLVVSRLLSSNGCTWHITSFLRQFIPSCLPFNFFSQGCGFDDFPYPTRWLELFALRSPAQWSSSRSLRMCSPSWYIATISRLCALHHLTLLCFTPSRASVLYTISRLCALHHLTPLCFTPSHASLLYTISRLCALHHLTPLCFTPSHSSLLYTISRLCALRHSRFCALHHLAPLCFTPSHSSLLYTISRLCALHNPTPLCFTPSRASVL
jgi:hypothetical protein